jgi:4-deoxy-L-threo-5-hexosulose-uronate ketol-isomerase
MLTRILADKVRIKTMNTEELRETFLLEDMFIPGEVNLTYSDTERAVVGGIVPSDKVLRLEGSKELASEYFNARRETGILNIGEVGEVLVDGKCYKLANSDCLYIGRGVKNIEFKSKNASKPAEFYVLSYPAHKEYPTKLISKNVANRIDLGSDEASNKRTIFQYIRPGVCESCQLVMGITALDSGSVWNTMAPHTHARRTEIYMYFDMDENDRVFHFMGEPDETKHLVMKNKEAVLSPSWSIHAGAGTSNYTFCWGMGGENQDFDDMDFIDIKTIR